MLTPDYLFWFDTVAASVSSSGPPQTFVLLVDDRPVGTASLVAHDLDERPDLTPWLAGVFVVPEARGRGHVVHLIQAVEVACRSAGVGTVWLHTADAERVYARAGWYTVEVIQREGRRPVTLMRRDLTTRGSELPS
jgi:GNAT superfamily N-acetyltransferase